jgi:SAM-dependent methyltransferase
MEIGKNYTRNQEIPPPMPEEIWETVWGKSLITSDYSLKYLDFMEEIEKTLPNNATVLEAGCGTGQTLPLFCSRHTTIGLDRSPKALSIAHPNCDTLIQGDIFHIPLKDGACDLVYNSGVIEHFMEPNNKKAVSEMVRVTKKGGFLVIIVPNSFCPWYRVGKSVAVIMKNLEFGYEEDYSLFRLRKTLESSGVSIVNSFGLQALPPLATNSKEVLPVKLRKKLGAIENYFPKKQYYAYAVGIVAKKSMMHTQWQDYQR